MDYKILENSIAIVGDIPSKLFTPHWFSSHNLVELADADNARVEVISNNFTKFEFVDIATIHAEPHRLVIGTINEAYRETIRDLMISILKVLDGKHITNIGFNHSYHYELSKGDYIGIGAKIAILDIWKENFEDPRVLNLEILNEKRADDYDGRYSVRLMPSNIINEYGVNIRLNDHFNNPGEEKDSVTRIINLISNYWDQSLVFAKSIHSNFWRNINK